MWKPLKIDDKVLMFKCNIVEDRNETKVILTNLKEIWCEYCSIDVILKRAKECNKRIEYDRDTILKTIQEIPNECDFTENDDFKTLMLKYSVENRPLNFNWKLKKGREDELMQLIVHPLLISINYLHKQNEELKLIIEKKDIEIQQYKNEGAIIRRSKIATEPFNEEIFMSKYPMKGIRDMTQLANLNYDSSKAIIQNQSEFYENNLNENASTSVSSATLLLMKQRQQRTPKKGKKFMKMQIIQTKQRLKAETKINYEDNDSCTPPMNLDEIKKNIAASTTSLSNNNDESNQRPKKNMKRKFKL